MNFFERTSAKIWENRYWALYRWTKKLVSELHPDFSNDEMEQMIKSGEEISK